MMAWRPLRKVGVLVVAAFVLAGSTGCEFEDIFGPRVESSLVRTASFVVASELTIDAETANGAVQLRGVEGQEDVQVRITLRSRGKTLEEANARLEKIVVHAEQEGSRVVLRYAANEQDSDVRRYSGVEFDVTLPGTADAHVETSNGAVRVERVRGDLDLTTSNGKVVVEGFAGDVGARTSNGAIAVDGGKGALRLETSNGRIEISNVEAIVDAKTSNGAIVFSGRPLDGAHHLSSSNGRISVRVPGTASIRFVARTSNSTISSSLPLAGDVTGRAWDAVLNAPAAATLTVETSNGSIDLDALLEAVLLPES
jgi:DUF4097 and DUF4098 domain-containing protein YvlB